MGRFAGGSRETIHRAEKPLAFIHAETCAWLVLVSLSVRLVPLDIDDDVFSSVSRQVAGRDVGIGFYLLLEPTVVPYDVPAVPPPSAV